MAQKHLGLTLMFIVCLMADTFIAAAEPDTSNSRNLSALSGRWTQDKAVSEMLGFDKEFQIPSAIVLHLYADSEKVVNQEEHQILREIVLRNKHTVVASGRFKWEEIENADEVDTGFDAECFITHYKGQTHIWHAAPFVGVATSPITRIPGSSKDRDLLFLGPNSLNAKRPTLVLKRGN